MIAEAAKLTLTIIWVAGTVAMVAWFVWAVFFQRPRKRNASYLPKPRMDTRDWQAEFRRMNKP